jgi:hypothetical protein
MFNNTQPLIIGAIGTTGIQIISSSSFNEALSIILQIIVAAGTLYKLYLDNINRRKNKKENEANK